MTYCIGVYCEDILIESGVNTNDIPHLMIDLQFQRRHGRVEVYAVKVVQKEDLTVTLATVTGLRPLSRLADLDRDDVSAEPHQ